MHAQLTISIHETAIGPVCEFTHNFCLQCGMAEREATRFTVAVSELITDVILFAYPQEARSYVDIRIQYHRPVVEFILSELGEPFDPDRHVYDPDKALTRDNFDGAGFHIMQAFTDEFLFINKGREGKEFRLTKRAGGYGHPIDELLEQPALKQQNLQNTPPKTERSRLQHYTIKPITPADAEDISKLIYRTYNYTYSKEDLYFPQKIEEAVAGNNRMGVIARSNGGEAVGYFAVLKKDDSNLAEVGEAVVSPAYRRQGIMGAMMEQLVDLGRRQQLSGLFGKAVTLHVVSQKVNAKYGFTSVALMLAETSNVVYKGFDEAYDQPVSIIIDYLPIRRGDEKRVYLPQKYRTIITESYAKLDMPVNPVPPGEYRLQESSSISLDIDYARSTAQLVVRRYGSDFRQALSEILSSLRKHQLNAIYLDLPLEDPATPELSVSAGELGFIYSGLIPRFHEEQDYLRLQRLFVSLDFSIIEVHTPFAQTLKSAVAEEYHEQSDIHK